LAFEAASATALPLLAAVCVLLDPARLRLDAPDRD
jgi:hypothetical protein